MTAETLRKMADEAHLVAETALETRKQFDRRSRVGRMMREASLGDSAWHRGREATLREIAAMLEAEQAKGQP